MFVDYSDELGQLEIRSMKPLTNVERQNENFTNLKLLIFIGWYTNNTASEWRENLWKQKMWKTLPQTMERERADIRRRRLRQHKM